MTFPAYSGPLGYQVTWVSWGGVMKDTLEVDPPAAVLLSDTLDEVARCRLTPG